MQRCAFTPYEGNEPYIFISYAHKDSKRVYPILEELNRRGYRVWYDDGIAPGSEWPENIAQHLSGCALTLAFISPSSIASDNCRREVTFALSKRKPFLGIILEPTEMSLGMEMQLSAQQCIMKYSYTNDDSFYTKVCSCPDLEPCLKKPAVQEKQPAAAPAAPAPAPQPKPAAPKLPAKPLDKKLVGIIAGAVAAIVLIVILVIAFSGGGEEPNQDPASTGSSQTQKPELITVLDYENTNITAETIESIKGQSALEELNFTGCTFETDLSFLAELEGLRRLKLSHCGITDAMVASLALEKLESLDISGNEGITDIVPLAGLTKLKALNAADCAITAIAEPFQCLRLEQLNLANNRIEDLSAFANCTILTHVDLSFTGVTNVDWVGKSAATLQVVNLSGNDYLYDWDVEFLGDCAALREVYLDSVYLGTLEFLKDATALEKLSANNCRISDLSPLRAIKNLNYLSLSWNRIQDITPLSGLQADGLVLDLAMNEYLTDLSALPVGKYKALNLIGNADLSTLPGVSGEFLVLHYSDAIASVLQGDPFAEYCLLACPTDKIVAMENLLGAEEVLFIETYEEYCGVLEALEMDYRFILQMIQ